MKLRAKLFQILALLLPVQLGLHFWPEWSLVSGIRVDYLAPTVYLTDLIVLALLLSWLIEEKFKILRNKKQVVLFLFVFVAINISHALVWQVSLYKWLRLFLFFFLGVYVSLHRDQVEKLLLKPLLISLTFCLFLGLGQVLTEKTIGGLFWYLGERSFNQQTPGIALGRFFGRLFLRPYATFSHPNSLAGFYLASLTLFFVNREKMFKGKHLSTWLLSLLVCVFGVLISYSQNALLALFIIGLLVFLKIIPRFKTKGLSLTFIILFFVVLSFWLPLFSVKLLEFQQLLPEAIVKRAELNVLAGEVFVQEPLWGVGLGNSILAATKKVGILRTIGLLPTEVSSVWRLQPVHNIFLLMLNQVGGIGSLLLISWFLKNLKPGSKYNLSFLAILLTGFFDHYWLTLQQNQLLLIIILGLFLGKINKRREMKHN